MAQAGVPRHNILPSQCWEACIHAPHSLVIGYALQTQAVVVALQNCKCKHSLWHCKLLLQAVIICGTAASSHCGTANSCCKQSLFVALQTLAASSRCGTANSCCKQSLFVALQTLAANSHCGTANSCCKQSLWHCKLLLQAVTCCKQSL